MWISRQLVLATEGLFCYTFSAYCLDLAIAVSMWLAIGVIEYLPDEKTVFLGELSLDGRVITFDGALPMINFIFNSIRNKELFKTKFF